MLKQKIYPLIAFVFVLLVVAIIFRPSFWQKKIDYSLIYDKDIAQRLENYITSVASYHIKNKKYESVFNKIKYDPEIYKKED